MNVLEFEATADNLEPVRLIVESLDAHVGAAQIHLIAEGSEARAIDVILSDPQARWLAEVLARLARP